MDKNFISSCVYCQPQAMLDAKWSFMLLLVEKILIFAILGDDTASYEAPGNISIYLLSS